MARKILLIDDLRDFRDVTEDMKVTVARTSAEALAILASDTIWDEIWFDHDLGKVDDKVDSTLPILDLLCEAAFNDTPVDVGICYVHTSNPVGRNNILSGLDRYGYQAVRVNAPDYFIVQTEEA